MYTLSPLAAFILRYDALLQRYARFIIRNEQPCAILVKDVFETWFELYGKSRHRYDRNLLRRLTHAICIRYRDCTASS